MKIETLRALWVALLQDEYGDCDCDHDRDEVRGHSGSAIWHDGARYQMQDGDGYEADGETPEDLILDWCYRVIKDASEITPAVRRYDAALLGSP